MLVHLRAQARPAADLAGLFLGLAVVFAWGVADAGPGHDHGHDHGGGGASAAPASPRLVAESDAFELVGVLENEALTVYLDRRKDTAPVTDAKIELLIDGEVRIAEPQPDGTYRATSPKFAPPGEKEVVVTIAHDGASDLLVGVLREGGGASGHDHSRDPGHDGADGGDAAHERASGLLSAALRFAGASARSESGRSSAVMALIGVGLAVGVLLGAALRWRKGFIAALALLSILFGADRALAGPGHDHGGGGAAAVNGDAPQRLASGVVFLPKKTQRLLDIRTRVLSTEEARSTRKLIGRVIADPNRAGLAQSTIGGRVRLTGKGLPHLGRKVEAGEILALVEPAFAPIDASDVRQTAGDLEQRVALVKARIQRRKDLVARNAASRADLEDLEIELAGLEARRALLADSRSKPEPLIAPVDGVVASVDVMAGQVVEAGDTLFRIVDPERLWVEALSYDPDLALDDGEAAARLPSGERFDLEFVGRSRTLRQQAMRLHFRILRPSDALNIGAPIKIEVATGAPARGIIVNRRAVAQAPNGQMVVFKRLAPERYEPVAIAFESVDLERVRVTKGLRPRDQIIVQGAQLVNQIR